MKKFISMSKLLFLIVAVFSVKAFPLQENIECKKVSWGQLFKNQSELIGTKVCLVGYYGHLDFYEDRAALENMSKQYLVFPFYGDVNESGKPVNIEVIKSEPSNVFDEQAKSALSRWEYHPKVVDGIAQVDTGLDVTIEFKRSDK